MADFLKWLWEQLVALNESTPTDGNPTGPPK